MYVEVKNIKEDGNEITYEFFNGSCVSNGIFVLYKDRMEPFTFDMSCRLIKPIDGYAPEAHYQRAMVAVMKSYKKNGKLPEKSFFMSG
ncbi:hypothetical protein Q6344_00330 [Psychrobacter cibarius]|uniref:hypothetical protein n=1 Tax=Psychrobacter TaxID=497 RepID=UPI002022C26A|nr:hypothetical protein [Psychrobacter sp. WY6]WLG13842.1 hypothetical protein Q6344_00330 [Psychrobacter cibarius]